MGMETNTMIGESLTLAMRLENIKPFIMTMAKMWFTEIIDDIHTLKQIKNILTRGHSHLRDSLNIGYLSYELGYFDAFQARFASGTLIWESQVAVVSLIIILLLISVIFYIIMTNIMYGGRVFLATDVGAIDVPVVIGTWLSLIAAYFGGVTFTIIMILTYARISIPYLLTALDYRCNEGV